MDEFAVWLLSFTASLWGSITCNSISRSINNKSMKNLTTEEKGKVVEFFQEQVEARSFKERTLPFFGIMFVLFSLSDLANFPLLLISCIVLNFAWFRIITPKRISNLSAIGLPVSYEKNYKKYNRFYYAANAFRIFLVLSSYMAFASTR